MYNHNTGTSSIGNTPPTTNNARQSISGGNTCVSTAENPPPIGMPQNMIAAVCARLPGALSSVAIAIMFGNAPPKPSPARNRSTNSIVKLLASATPSVNTPNVATAAMNTGLRPTRSANHPPNAAPMTSPMLLTENTQPIWLGLSPNSGMSRGAATPIAWMSKPSSTAQSRHNATVTLTFEARVVVTAPISIIA